MGEMITVHDGEFAAYRADPEGEPKGGLIVIHEIWGLVDHIHDVADRFAGQGYLVVAPDLLSGIGISPEVGSELLRLRNSADQEEQTRAQPMMREKLAPLQSPEYARWAVSALGHTLDYLDQQPGVGRRLAVTGFCFGGSYSFALAAADRRVLAAVAFYGAPPDESDIAAINCPVLAFYGENDERLMTSLPDVRQRMSAAGVDFTDHVYPGVGHAFFNDTNPHAYDQTSAQDAWRRSLALLEQAMGPAAS